ncbi:MAG: MBL fold metallo-hydrolase [Oscillospiraceae bacterium]|nr:MBL fold metallo-hydrolase [Oscillospiraceae bacterium]
MLTKLAEELYVFPLELPDTPLKSLNCYVIRPDDGGRCLLIDSGFRHPRCWEMLCAGMEEAGLRPENTDVFFTHVHADHTGNGAALHALGCRLFMSATDYAVFCAAFQGTNTRQVRGVREGMPPALMEELNRTGPVFHYGSPWFPVTELSDGDLLCYGRYRLRCLLTPGHTVGHMCLYDEAHRLIFLGDHVLFSISPNIVRTPFMEDALGQYMESLKKVAALPVELALPSHRELGSIPLAQRVDQRLAHHRRRLDQALAVIGEHGPITAYDVTSRLHWHIRADSWEDFPLSQKWFAMGETLAHLDYLCSRGLIVRDKEGPVVLYSLPKT